MGSLSQLTLLCKVGTPHKFLIMQRGIHATSTMLNYRNAERAGKREVVGFGEDGSPSYSERVGCPFPAIRFREPDDRINALREKEKGDWKNLSMEEKKELYRASFWKTFEEIKAPTGNWKLVVSIVCTALAACLWTHYLGIVYLLPPLPESMSNEHREWELRRMVDLRSEPVSGVGSKWDYENNRWKA